MNKKGRGLVLGKFMPPHLGHVYLVDFARHYCEELTVLVGTLASEPIDGALRFAWMQQLFAPDVRVLHLTEELPQESGEHPDFWQLWQDAIEAIVPEKIDYVFASEDYGHKLAEVLGATYVPVDQARELVPVSGTAVRRDPMAHWAYIPAIVRPYFVRRVCVFGPESTGKTTLTRALAKHYATIGVGEYARRLLEQKNGLCERDDIERIARGQMASEDALASAANRLMFCDTDLLLTTIWSKTLFGHCPAWIEAEAAHRSYDLYLLMEIDVAWVADPVRYLPDDRAAFMQRCIEALERKGCRYVRISGGWDERFEAARAAVDAMLAGR